MNTFNFRGPDQEKKVGVLSGGERNRVHLSKLLRKGSNVLLLDEPTNDLDVDTLRALEEAILNYAGALWSRATIAGSSTVWPRISWPLKAMATFTGVKETTRLTNSNVASDWASVLSLIHI